MIITPLPRIRLGMTPEDVATDYYGVHSCTAYRVSQSQHSLIVLCTPYHELFQMTSRRQRIRLSPGRQQGGRVVPVPFSLSSLLFFSLSPTALFLWYKISKKSDQSSRNPDLSDIIILGIIRMASSRGRDASQSSGLQRI